MVGLKVSTMGPQISKNWFFAPEIFRGHIINTFMGNTPQDMINFRTYCAMWQIFIKVGSETSKNMGNEKR